MNRLLIFLLRRSGPLLWALTLAVVLVQAWLLWQLAPLEPSVVALQLAFSPARFWQILAGWQAPGVALFREHFVLDHPYTLLYAAWGALVAWRSRLCLGLSARRRWWLAGLLPLAAVADLAENACHLWLLAHGPGVRDGLVPVASTVSALKWALLAAFAAVMAWRIDQCNRARLELRIPPLALAAGLALWMGWVGWPSESPAFSLRWFVPAGLVLAGVALALAGVQAFRRAMTTVNPLQPLAASAMVTGGVYRISRNPMYLGMALGLLGWGLWLGDWRVLPAVPVFVAWPQRYQIAPEERALAARFGPAFRLYCAQVRRWL